jgi:hypothetical protein
MSINYICSPSSPPIFCKKSLYFWFSRKTKNCFHFYISSTAKRNLTSTRFHFATYFDNVWTSCLAKLHQNGMPKSLLYNQRCRAHEMYQPFKTCRRHRIYKWIKNGIRWCRALKVSWCGSVKILPPCRCSFQGEQTGRPDADVGWSSKSPNSREFQAHLQSEYLVKIHSPKYLVQIHVRVPGAGASTRWSTCCRY